MRETVADLDALQQLLDTSYAHAGHHLREVITADRRLTAPDVAGHLEGVCLLALATVTEDGRPLVAPVDGIFYRARFYFGSSADSVRFRHLRRRPHVSATHAPTESLAVTVHGRAVEIDVSREDNGGFRRALLDAYLPRYGPQWEHFLDNGPVYARIDAHRMFTFSMRPGVEELS